MHQWIIALILILLFIVVAYLLWSVIRLKSYVKILNEDINNKLEYMQEDFEGEIKKLKSELTK
jgi:cell division protein FtsB